jgi:hypothetical protein
MFNEQNTVENYERPIPPAPFPLGKGEPNGFASPLVGETERGSYARS